MNRDESELVRQRRIDGEAAEWVARRFCGFSSSQQDAFFEWLAADPAHSEAYVRHQDLWTRMGTLAEWMPEHSETPHRDLLKNRPTLFRSFWLGGVAAAVIVGMLLWLPEVLAPKEIGSQSYVASDYQRHTLPDGSIVEMNSGAAMVLNFTSEERRIDLVSSEALFHVAKDVNRPFIVSAKGVEVRAVGTAFNVRVTEQEVEVLVTEGQVRLDKKASGFASDENPNRSDSIAADLHAGQRSSISLWGGFSQAIVTEVDEAAIFERLAWKYRLEFDSIPLSEAVARINRRSVVQLEIADEEIAELLIVGTLRMDNIEHCVELIELTLDITSERVNDRKVILKRKR